MVPIHHTFESVNKTQKEEQGNSCKLQVSHEYTPLCHFKGDSNGFLPPAFTPTSSANTSPANSHLYQQITTSSLVPNPLACNTTPCHFICWVNKVLSSKFNLCVWHLSFQPNVLANCQIGSHSARSRSRWSILSEVRWTGPALSVSCVAKQFLLLSQHFTSWQPRSSTAVYLSSHPCFHLVISLCSLDSFFIHVWFIIVTTF